jgi:hypothetical protein
MIKCDFCGKEVLVPFKCSYCKLFFCTDHRLPESHECQGIPKSPVFWYHKRLQTIKQLEPSFGVICPKCRSHDIGALGFDEKEVHYVCNLCNHDWVAPRQTRKAKNNKDLEIVMSPS